MAADEEAERLWSAGTMNQRFIVEDLGFYERIVGWEKLAEDERECEKWMSLVLAELWPGQMARTS